MRAMRPVIGSSVTRASLSDDEVYDLLQQARFLFMNRIVETELGEQIIRSMLIHIDLTQRAMVAMQEEAKGDPPS